MPAPDKPVIHTERLDAGVIHVAGRHPAGEVRVELVFCGQVLATATASAGADNRFRATLSLPAETLSQGVLTYTLRLQQQPDVLSHFTIIAGEVLNTDLHAELAQLREEVELLKAAFRRHCAESGG